jgi:hypothetical protein
MSGQQSRAMLTLEAQLTIRDAIVMPRPLVKWSFEAPDPASVPAVIARAARIAMAAPSGPVFVSVPLDDWQQQGFESFVVKKPDLACVGYLDFCVAARCGSVHCSDDTTDMRAQDRPLRVFEDKNGDPSPR